MAETSTLELRRRQALAAAGLAPSAAPAAAAPPSGPAGALGAIDDALGAAGRIGQRAVAATLGAPVDLVNAGLGAAGVPVSNAPLGGRQSLESLLRMFEDPVLAGAAGTSVAFPPAAPALAATRVAPVLARLGIAAPSVLGRTAATGARFGPTVAAAGGGGAIGGAAEQAMQGGTPAEIGEAALRSGAEMAAGEAAGLGIGSAAARAAAPALGHLTDIGRRALDFARRGGDDMGAATTVLTGQSRGLPIAPADVAPTALARGLQSLVDGFLPTRAVAKGRRQAVVNRLLELGPGEDLNPAIRSLISADTAEAALPRATRVADAVETALGSAAAKRLKLDFEAPRTALFNLVTRHPEAAGALRGRLGEQKFNDMLAASLERLLSRSSRTANGRMVIDGDRLLAAWRDLPAETRGLFPKATQEGIEGLGAFAAVSRRVPELSQQQASATQAGLSAATGALAPLAAGFGAEAGGMGAIGLGSSVLMARSLMDPKGWLNRWLTSEALPPEVLRIIGRETTKAASRTATRGTLDNR